MIALLGLLLLTYLFNAVIFILFLATAFAFRKTKGHMAGRKALLLLSFLMPMPVWVLLTVFDHGKTLSNAFVEPLLIGMFTGVINLIFLYRDKYDTVLWIILLLLLPIAVDYAVPTLAE